MQKKLRILIKLVAVLSVLLVYSYPALRARSELKSSALPPMFAPDLSMYLNLSISPPDGGSEFLNPYYLVRVPYNGSGYLKFHLAPGLYNLFRAAFGGRLWISMFVWNTLWWFLLALASMWLLENFLPRCSLDLTMLGLVLLMLFNFGVLKAVVLAWVHLPSFGGFNSLALPFMRAFIPITPTVFLIVYLALQMKVLRAENSAVLVWVVMGVLQLMALASFPYATLMMAGITALTGLHEIFSEMSRKFWIALISYGACCAVADGIFVLRGSAGFYSGHTASIDFQPLLLPHLIGGNWLILGTLTTVVLLSKKLTSPLKWPLAGLGITNLILMLGDALVPARTILLSHHAGHFIHISIALLLIFVISAHFGAQLDSPKGKFIVRLAILLLAVNGILLSAGAYRGFWAGNEELSEIAVAFQGKLKPASDDLVLARARFVDDPCGWVFLLTRNSVLYCSDAEVMLTPAQNLNVHRFRQAVYLYLTGRDSRSLRSALAGPNRLNLMYELGYWAEAVSLSRKEQADGVREIESDLIPLLERVERHDVVVEDFFRQFPGIVVVDTVDNPIFSQERLATFLKISGSQPSDHLQISTFTAK